jgi:DNA-binding transcriptional MerR regulator
MDGILIKDIAEKLDLNPKTIRFYEDIGLIPKPQRNQSNYRIYSEDDIKTLSFVKKARSLGISTQDIKKIINLRKKGTLPCCTVIGILEKEEKDLEQKIQEMILFKEKISRTVKSFKENIEKGSEGKICGLIEQLFEE